MCRAYSLYVSGPNDRLPLHLTPKPKKGLSDIESSKESSSPLQALPDWFVKEKQRCRIQVFFRHRKVLSLIGKMKIIQCSLWLGGIVVGRRTRDQQVASSTLGLRGFGCILGQVVHTQMPLSPKRYKFGTSAS